MSSVIDIIEAISERLPPSLDVKIGPEFTGATRAPPRVVWLPVEDGFEAPPNRGASPRRALHTILSTWQAILFACAAGQSEAASFRALEALRDQVLAAVFAVCRGNAAVQSGRFDQQDGAAILKFGRTYTLTVQFAVESLSASSLSLATVEATNITGALNARLNQ